MKGRLARAAPYVLLLAVAGALYAAALRIDYVGPADRIGPDFWPRAVLILLAAVCVYEIAKSLVATQARSAGGMLQLYLDTAPAGTGGGQRPSAARAALAIGATLAYVLLVGVLGFFLATAAFLAGFIALGGYRRWGMGGDYIWITAGADGAFHPVWPDARTGTCAGAGDAAGARDA